MKEKHRQPIEDETPTMKKLRALVHQVGTGAIAFETVVPQMILTLLLGGTAAYLAITGQSLPDWLQIALGAVIGFYFGSDFEFRRITGKVK
jgi:uncharacterized membrane protein AbrB (regulator of aidB expression)